MSLERITFPAHRSHILDRHSSVVWLLAIQIFIFDVNPWFTSACLKVTSDMKVNGRPRFISAAQHMSPGLKPGTPVNAKFFHGR